MLQNLHLKYSKRILKLIFLFLFLYVAIRAYSISFTHDESLTYNIINGYDDFKMTANNHLLNTFLSSISKTLFGSKEFFLRLPNVLAFIVYLYFTYKIISKTGMIVLMLLGASLLLFNSYLLDFLSLSRGYGLALGFSLASLYFLFESDTTTYKQYTTRLFLSLLFSVLAAYSNLMYVNLNIAIVIVFGIELLLLRQKKTIEFNKKRTLILASIFILNILLIAFLVDWLLMLKDNNQLFYGGKDGFIENTIASLVLKSYCSYENINRLSICVIFLFGVSVLYAIINIRKMLTAQSKSVLILTLMILGTII